MSDTGDVAILTLEPLLDAVREGVEVSGWELSGLQKTTSHQFEGRWEGESTRSAYLFFHRPGDERGSVDVFLDETPRGLRGNLALVLDGPDLGGLGDPVEALGTLSAQANDPSGRRTPLTLRLRLASARDDVATADTEVRFKIVIPRSVIAAGHGPVASMVCEAMRAFGRLLERPALRELGFTGGGAD